MGQLERDIQALADIATSDSLSRDLDLGYLSCRKFAVLIKSEKDRQSIAEEARAAVAGSSEDARIAVVYADCLPTSNSMWAAAARNFCNADIASVFVIHPFRLSSSLRRHAIAVQDHTLLGTGAFSYQGAKFEEFLVSRLPPEFERAGLPIFYDEYGCLAKAFPRSEMLSHDSRLEFASIDPTNRDHVVGGFNDRWKGTVVLYDASGTDDEDSVARSIVEKLVRTTDLHCRNNLHRGTGFVTGNLLSVYDIAWVADQAFPGCIDLDAIKEACETKSAFDAPYAVTLNSENERVSKADAALSRLRDVFTILGAALASRQYSFSPLKEVMGGQIRAACEENGAIHQIEALMSGVPVEDIVI